MSDEADARPLILHVVESLGAGVNTAVEDYIRSTPQFRHRILGSARAEMHSVASLRRLTEGIDLMGKGTFRRIRDVRGTVRRHRPDVVHAHSSFAGAYVRLAGVKRERVAYTPHCFPFERRDVVPPVRALFWLAEAMLGLRTGVFVAVSPREAALARRLPGRARVVTVPNVARIGKRAPAGEPGAPALVVALGRVSPQKGSRFFGEAVRAYRAAGGRARWRWIGGGDSDLEEELREAGAEVTGWVERSEALRELRDADAYVHTAAWEGFPITLLEAAAMGKPVVGRRIAALEGAPITLVDGPPAMARAVAALDSEDVRRTAMERSRRLASEHDVETQARMLGEVYGRIARG